MCIRDSGEFMMAGAYAAYIVAGLIPYSGISLLVALPVGFLSLIHISEPTRPY